MFETNLTRRFTFSFGTILSLLLHACFLPVFFWAARSPHLHQAIMRQLNIEIQGPIANRQVVTLQKRIVNPRPSNPAPQKQERQEIKPVPNPSPALPEIKAAPSESHNDSPDTLHLPQPAASVESSHSGGGAPSRNGNGDIDQKAQAVGHRSTEVDLINAYSSALAKLVNSHLIYPNDVRKKRYEGVSWVTFVVANNGALKPNTLQIKKSSGYAVLDSNALKTIQSLAPFPKPPFELTISLSVDFAVDW